MQAYWLARALLSLHPGARSEIVLPEILFHDVDYRTPRKLDKALFQQLATGRWIAEHRSLMVTGPCGPAS